MTIIPDEEIAHHRSMAALTLLQKHIHQRNLTALIDSLVSLLLHKHLSSSSLVISLVNYMIQVGEASDAQTFVHKLAQRVPQHGEALMTIAEQLEQKGIEKGRKEEALKIARTMLNNGLDRPTVIKMTGLTEDELAKLRH